MKVPFVERQQHFMAGRPFLWNMLTVIGLIAIGAIIVPAVFGLITAAPDIVRYIKIRRM